MIEIGFEFRPSSRWDIIEALFSLPEAIRPSHQCRDEADSGTLIGDHRKFLEAFERRETGTMLKGPAGVFDISLAGKEVIRISSFIDSEPETMMAFFINMSRAAPIFGFACMPEEREYRNRVTTIQGMNTVESWVGRDTKRYIPGLYWITLISADLMQQHGVTVERLGKVAHEHVDLVGGQHLFRFYGRPEDWERSNEINDLINSQPGIFHLEGVKTEMAVAKTFLELNAATRKWK